MLRRFVSLILLALLGGHSPTWAAELDRRTRTEVLTASADLLERRYVDAARGRVMADAIRADASRDRWSSLRSPQAFAEAVTLRLRELSHDGHLGLSHSEKAVPADEGERRYDAAEHERWYGAHVNHGFEQVSRLPGEIGYLDLRVFPPPAMAGDMAPAAMTLLAQSKALVIDLRKNGGGHGEFGNLLASYLFDGAAQPMSGAYDRPSDKHTYATTPVWAPGRRLGSGKPVFILIGPRTFSAAEAFAYDLQALGRATIVGEPSGGGAHPFKYRRVHPHFVLSLAEGRSVNPITGGNWQGVGVKPDVLVPQAQALDRALELAREAVTTAR